MRVPGIAETSLRASPRPRSVATTRCGRAVARPRNVTGLRPVRLPSTFTSAPLGDVSILRSPVRSRSATLQLLESPGTILITTSLSAYPAARKWKIWNPGWTAPMKRPTPTCWPLRVTVASSGDTSNATNGNVTAPSGSFDSGFRPPGDETSKTTTSTATKPPTTATAV